MATLNGPLVKPKIGLKEFGREFLKLFLSPGSLLFFGLALTEAFWIGPAIYLLIRTNLVAPIGFVPWVLCILAGSSFLGGLAFVVISSASSKEARLARECFKKGDADGYHAHLSEFRKRRRFWPLWGALLSCLVLLPSSIAIVLGGGMPGLVREHGKLRFATPREQVQITLRWIEKRGIVGWTGKG